MPAVSDDSKVSIVYGFVTNRNAHAGGFLPVIYVNGKMHGDTYSARGYDADRALVLASNAALEEAARYIGDWKITINEAVANGG